MWNCGEEAAKSRSEEKVMWDARESWEMGERALNANMCVQDMVVDVAGSVGWRR